MKGCRNSAEKLSYVKQDVFLLSRYDKMIAKLRYLIAFNISTANRFNVFQSFVVW